ncbi:hypothetical protein B484DRAFT_401638, partial [Ochromonadaceae sp. CCMP2298]
MTSAENIARMRAQNTYWPDYGATDMGNMHRFAKELSDNSRQYQSTTQMREYLFERRQLGHDGFNVTIVFVYREYIAHLISWHYQKYHRFNGHYIPFSEYLMGLDVTERKRDYITLLKDSRR